MAPGRTCKSWKTQGVPHPSFLPQHFVKLSYVLQEVKNAMGLYFIGLSIILFFVFERYFKMKYLNFFKSTPNHLGRSYASLAIQKNLNEITNKDINQFVRIRCWKDDYRDDNLIFDSSDFEMIKESFRTNKDFIRTLRVSGKITLNDIEYNIKSIEVILLNFFHDRGNTTTYFSGKPIPNCMELELLLDTPLKKKREFQIGHYHSTMIVELSEVKTDVNTILIKGLNLTEDNTLLIINQKRLTTMLDFTDAGDYQVLYLNDNFFIVGGSYAIKNEFGFIQQTQMKNVLLIKMKDGNQTLKDLKNLMTGL